MSSGIVESTESGSSKEKENKSASSGSTDITRRRLSARLAQLGGNLPGFVEELIRHQGTIVAGTEAAAFLIDRNGEELSLRNIAHVRPDESTEEVRRKAIQAFVEIIKDPVIKGQDMVIQLDDQQQTIDPQFCLVTMLRAEQSIIGVSAVITRCPNVQRAQQRLSQMELVAGYFEMFGLRRAIDQSRNVSNTNQAVLQLATTVATAEGFESASMNLCNELATRTGATRVAVGWVVGEKIKLKAMSHTEQFDKKQELAVLIIAAMEECLDQEELVQYDPHPQVSAEGEVETPSSSDNVTRAAAELSRRQGGVAVLNMPLRRAGDIVGIICLEFNPQKRIGPHAATSLAVAAELIAPQLFDRYQNDRWWITKTGISIREMSKLAIGKTHMLPKTIIILVFAGLTFICLYSPMYSVVAPFSFAATEKRIVSSPAEGFVGNVVNVRPGDHVKAGDVLMEMDTTELKIRLADAMSEREARNYEAMKLAADPSKQADMLQKRKERDAADAQAQLYQYQIENAIVKAPIDGVVLSGEWQDKRRTPVKKGDELFRIAQNDMMRAELKVEENDIQDIKEGAVGELSTSAQPSLKTPLTVERIIPLPNSESGKNVFNVYAVIDKSKLDPTWRDGMQGEASVNVKPRPLIWKWTHRLIEWVRIKLWV